MSFSNIGLLDIMLIAICLVLLLLSGFLFLRLMKRRKQCAELQKDLELQRSRVLARKAKIRELRKKMHDLSVRLAEDEQKLLSSYSQEEIEAFYPGVRDALRQLLGSIELDSLPPSRQADIMSAAIRLSHQLQSAFRMPEEPLLDEESAGQEGVDLRIVPRRVLIVDDNEESRRYCAEVVETSGFLVDLAANGEEAVEKVRLSREGYYDLILMDLIMHDKNGYETCRDIRKLSRTDSERVPVIALTANSFSEDYVQLIDAGMNDRISKPISRESFLDIVEKWLQRSDKNEEAPPEEAREDSSWLSVFTPDSGSPVPGRGLRVALFSAIAGITLRAAQYCQTLIDMRKFMWL